MRLTTLFTFLLLSVPGNPLFAQQELVILKGERRLLNLSPGDDFVYRLKGEKKVQKTFINNLSDTAVVTHKDTVALHIIDRIYFKRSTAYNKLGVLLTVAGAGYFLIDQINNSLVNGNPVEVDPSVGKTSAILVGAGLPLWLIRKKSERIHRRSRILVVDPDSPFYQRKLNRAY